MPSFACAFVCPGLQPCSQLPLPLISNHRLDPLVVLLLIWEPMKPLLFLSQIPFHFDPSVLKLFFVFLIFYANFIFPMGSRPLVVFACICRVGDDFMLTESTEHHLTHRSCLEIALLRILGWETIFCGFVADFAAFFDSRFDMHKLFSGRRGSVFKATHRWSYTLATPRKRCSFTRKQNFSQITVTSSIFRV